MTALLTSAFPGLLISRFSRIDSNTVNDFNSPSLLFAVQGAKVITVGQRVYTLDKLEINASVSRCLASHHADYKCHSFPSELFLGIRLDLDSRRISELVLKVYAHGLPPLVSEVRGAPRTPA